MSRNLFYWLWASWFLYFAAIEGIAVYNEIAKGKGDGETLTHFIASQLPIGVRIALIAWLAYHFIWVHKHT